LVATAAVTAASYAILFGADAETVFRLLGAALLLASLITVSAAPR
jgi:hypothetical protein